MTHCTLLMRQCFLREFPQITAYRNGMPLLSRLRTLVLGFFHCFQTTHLRRWIIQPFKDLKLINVYPGNLSHQSRLSLLFSSLTLSLSFTVRKRVILSITRCAAFSLLKHITKCIRIPDYTVASRLRPASIRLGLGLALTFMIPRCRLLKRMPCPAHNKYIIGMWDMQNCSITCSVRLRRTECRVEYGFDACRNTLKQRVGAANPRGSLLNSALGAKREQ